MERQVGFTEIDLRWGITDQASQNGEAVELCLAEIDRCRDFPPFFIGLIGERYGWTPKYEELSKYWETNKESAYLKQIRDAVNRGISVTELEMDLGVLSAAVNGKCNKGALFCLRDESLTKTFYSEAKTKNPNLETTDFYDPSNGKLNELKGRIQADPFLEIVNYESLERFGEEIETYLKSKLDEYFPENKALTQLEIVQEAHSAFRHHRLQNYVPRQDVQYAVLDAIEEGVENSSHHPILLCGPSGQGKSAFLAHFARHIEENNLYASVHWVVIDHYVGADKNNSIRDWLERVFLILSQKTNNELGPVPQKYEDKVAALPQWLIGAAEKVASSIGNGKAVQFLFILDAIDQLEDFDSSELSSISRTVGSSAAMIFSLAADIKIKTQHENFKIIEVPPLTEELKRQMISKTLSKFGKELSPEILCTLTASPRTQSPLYLALVLEKIRLDAQHETLSAYVDNILTAPDAGSLFLSSFLCDADYNRPPQADLAVFFMALLAASRTGLSEIELADLLALKNDPIAADTGMPRLPQLHLSRLLTVFKPFLFDQQGGCRKPMHRLLGVTAWREFKESEARKKIADYFLQKWRSLATLEFQPSKEVKDLIIKKVSTEGIGQLWKLGEYDVLVELITDAPVAICLAERNKYEFSRYWTTVMVDKYDSSTQAEKLVQSLFDHHKLRSDTKTKAHQSIAIADALRMVDEIESAGIIYQRIFEQRAEGDNVPDSIFKDALRGYVQWCSASIVTVANFRFDEKIIERYLDILFDLTTNDSPFVQAQDSLLCAEFYSNISALPRAQKLIEKALSITEKKESLTELLLHSVRGKAFAMLLKASACEIEEEWEKPHIRNGLIINALKKAQNFDDYFRNLNARDPQRIFLLETLHTLYSHAAEAMKASSDIYWPKAVEFAWRVRKELDESMLVGYSRDFRLLNAAETVALALKSGYQIDKEILDQFIKDTSPRNSNDINSEFRSEVHTMLNN